VISPGRPDREAGNAALELVILAPALLFIIGLIIALGRVSTAQNAVSDAARDAARQASLQLTGSDASAVGQASAQAALAQDGLHCSPAPQVFVDTTGANGFPGFQAQVGQPAVVTAIVTCDVSLAQIIVPGLPGSETITESFTSPIDPYREKQP
jgi:Flp pilus assembly protein TadG